MPPDRTAYHPACCVTAAFFAKPPTDLITWAQAEAAVATSPYPMSARDLKRKFKAEPSRLTYTVRGIRGEHVSRSAVLEFHRDLVNNWIAATGRRN